MNQEYLLISVEERDYMLRNLERALHICNNARPTTWPMSDEDLHAEPTEFYSGATGYSRATMGLIEAQLKNLLPAK